MLRKMQYVAVRRDTYDGHDWIDCSSVHCLPEQVQQNIRETEELIPGWCAANPVVRVCPVTLTVDD